MDKKLLRKAVEKHKKLETEIAINNYLVRVEYFEDYRDIKKSIKRITTMLDIAKKNTVAVDEDICSKCTTSQKRLLAERNLRFAIL